MLNWNINEADFIQESHVPLGEMHTFEQFSSKFIRAWEDELQIYSRKGWYGAIEYGNTIFEFCTPYTPLHNWDEIDRHVTVYIINTKLCADILASLLPFNNVENLIEEFISICNVLLIQSVHES